MANKRAKATIARGKKRAPVKQAYQRRQKSAIRFRNDQLREDLDRRAQALYVTPQLPVPQSSETIGLQKDPLSDLLDSFSSANL
ncbi:hypothetical protein Ac2012v2_004527 [Leucoagaricus gongylophorus]